jgi:hypothetical protein
LIAYWTNSEEREDAVRAEVAADVRWLQGAVAFVWLVTGVSVLHPYYQEVGTAYLALLGSPSWLMVATCVGEILLGLRVLLGTPATWVTLLQGTLILGFTVILAWLDPWLLASPYGILAKNGPLLAVIGTTWLLAREGWSRRAVWLLRGGLAFIWIAEGLFSKILLQQQGARDVVAGSGLVPGDPAVFLRWLGAGEVVAGVLLLVLSGRLLGALLFCQLVALVVLPVLVGWQDERLWVHPFGPLLKNVPILAGTAVLLRHVWPRKNESPLSPHAPSALQ